MYLKAALAHCIALVFLFQSPLSSPLPLGALLLVVVALLAQQSRETSFKPSHCWAPPRNEWHRHCASLEGGTQVVQCYRHS